MPLEIADQSFYLDGCQIQLVSGAMHYFRTHPEQWRDRLRKMRACGLNTVETYVAWNLHEPEQGTFCFDGFADIQRFIETAADENLMVIVRPGPFICAEWEGGGLPWWLHRIPGIRLRCHNEPYLRCVDRFLDELMQRLRPLLRSRGGPIVAMQIENEYGSYGQDTRYLRHLHDHLRALGVDELLFTSDGPGDVLLQGGTLHGVLKTANFGSQPRPAFEKLREYETDGPLMCMEYWNGWFDHWGERHHTRAADDAAAVLEEMLDAGASVNFYMFHGGTNFGFMNGSNYFDEIQPTVTSYDYDAPLSESGNPTPKYYAFRDVISRHSAATPDVTVGDNPSLGYGEVEMTESAPLSALLNNAGWVGSATPMSMEELGQGYGFVLYRTEVSGDWPESKLCIRGLHDRAVIMVNGEARGVLERKDANDGLPISLSPGDELDILVENLGRVNFGVELLDRKGITGHVRLGEQIQFGWRMFQLPLKGVRDIAFGTHAASTSAPTFYRGVLEIEAVADTYLLLEGWTKGVAFINDFNLGRYWNVGPQRTLYIPAPLLQQGINELVLFELHGTTRTRARLTDQPVLG